LFWGGDRLSTSSRSRISPLPSVTNDTVRDRPSTMFTVCRKPLSL
jgi:hypothetical protein